MTSAVVTGGPGKLRAEADHSSRRRRRRPPRAALVRAHLERRYAERLGRDLRRQDERDGLSALIEAFVASWHVDGAEVHRSWKQLARACHQLGWAPETVAETKHHHRPSLRRRMDRLVELGYVERWEAVYAGRQSTGILVRLSADVAQLAEAPLRPRSGSSKPDPRRSATPRRRAFSAGQVSPPFGGEPPSGVPSYRYSGGRARGALERRDRAALADRCLATLSAHARSESGAASVRAAPWLADVPAVVLARAALRVHLPAAHPVISAERQRQLEAGWRRIRRYGYGGARPLDLTGDAAAAAAVLDLARGGWAEHLFTKPERFCHREPDRPRTLGGLGVALRRLANEERSADRGRRGRRGADQKRQRPATGERRGANTDREGR